MKAMMAMVGCVALLGACGGAQEVKGPDLVPVVGADSVGQAIAALNTRIVAEPNNAALYAGRARLFLSVDSVRRSLLDWQRAVSVDSTNSDYRVRLGEVFFRRLMVPQAQQQYEKAIALDAGNAEAKLKLADLRMTVRDYDKAMTLVNEVLKQDPTQAEAYYLKGWIHKETGDTAKSISSFRTAVEQDPSMYKAWMQLGVLHTQTRDPLALEYFNTALELRPNSVEALYDKGMYCQENGKDSLALECYKAITDQDPRYAGAWYNSGWVRLEHLKDYDQAIHDFTAAAKLLTLNYQAHYNRGLAYERKGVLDSAMMDYKQALEYKPDYDLAANGMQRMQDKGVKLP